MSGGDDPGRPLEGLCVIEHARGVAGQYAGRLLAVMGARVIKVEPPGGCPSRSEGPFLKADEASPASALFEYLNVEKQSVTLDLRQAQGQAQMAGLVDQADVLLDDTPVTQRPPLGLDPEDWLARQPRLVYTSVLPFGAFGPHRDRVGSELTLFHSGGEGYLMPNGLALEQWPDRPPVKIYGHFAELVGGTSAAVATLAAAVVQLDDIGQFVDVSVQDANLAIGCFALQRLGDGVVENRHGRSFKYGGVLQCADGFVEVLVLEQHQWKGLVQVMGDPPWAQGLDDPLERGRRGGEINEHIRAWARHQTVQGLVRSGQAAKVPVAPYNAPEAVLASPHNQERQVFDAATFHGLARQAMLVAPFRFPQQPLRAGPAPQAGAHNAEVLGAALRATPGAAA